MVSQSPRAEIELPNDSPPRPCDVTEIVRLLEALKLEMGEVRSLVTAKRKAAYTVGEIAQQVGRSAYTVRRWIARGRLRAIRIMGTGPRGRLLVPREEIDRLVRQAQGGTTSEFVGAD